MKSTNRELLRTKFNWNQTGMPTALVSQLGARHEYSEFKAVLSEAQNQVLTPVDAELMARELVEGGGREYVNMVRELSTALAQAQQELAEANRRYERLTENLERRGIVVEDNQVPRGQPDLPFDQPVSPVDAQAEWDEWTRRFQSLLDVR